MKRIIIRILLITAAVVVSVYLLGTFVWGVHQPNNSTVQELKITIEDADERQFIAEQDITALLQRKNLYPVGRVVDSVSTHAIEQAIRQHPMVRTAECYKLSSPIVRIRVTQRVPLLCVKTAAETYLVDTDRKRMVVPSNIDPMPIRVTGHVGERMAKEEIADFVCWLNRHAYWRERIAYIQVNSPKSVTLYQKGEEPRILLGELNDYVGKLRRLRTWYENADELPEMPKYYELDLRFRSQVIGRK